MENFIKKLLFMGTILLVSSVATGQTHRSTPEFMQSAGFQKVGDNEWKNDAGAIIVMDADSVVSFTAPQNHDWKLIFGDGEKFGNTFTIKSGEVITFKDGKIQFKNGFAFQLLSSSNSAKVSRGIAKSAFFNKERNVMNATDIKVVNAEAHSLGSLIPDENPDNEEALDEKGNFVKLRLMEEEKARKANASFKQAVQANLERTTAEKYNELCKKYGKNVIDKTLGGDIVVGAPMGLLVEVIRSETTYSCNLIEETKTFRHYELKNSVYETKKQWRTHYHVIVDAKTGIITQWYTRHKYY